MIAKGQHPSNQQLSTCPTYHSSKRKIIHLHRLFHKGEYLISHGFLMILQKVFHAIGVFIASFPYIFLLASLLFSTVSYGVIYVRFAQRLQDGFTASNSPSRYEEEIFAQFTGSVHSHTQHFIALIRAADGSSMLRLENLQRALDVNEFLRYQFFVEIDGLRYRQGDFCTKYCEINKPLHIIKETLQIIDDANRYGILPNKSYIIDHPKSIYQDYEVSVALNLFGIERKKVDDTFLLNSSQWSNSTLSKTITAADSVRYGNRLKHVEMISLIFYASSSSSNVTNILARWENEVFEWAKNSSREFPELIIDVLGDKVLGREMVRGGLSLIPHLCVGLLLSVIFVLVSVIFSSVRHRRIDFAKVLVVMGIITSPLLAVCTTFGIMGLAKIEIYPIQMVIPFLILAVGVDDAFLMLHAWNRLAPSYDHLSSSERFQAIPSMFGKVLEEVGPSITITSLTNAMAFAIGTTVSTPAIQLFCMAATIAMIVDYVFELTLFGALLSLSARIEKAWEKSSSKLHDRKHQKHEAEMRKLNDSTIKKEHNRLLRCYCEALTTTWARLILVAFIVTFFTVSLVGTLRIRTYINAQKIIPSDSRLLRADALCEKYQWKEYEPLFVFVNNPPDISDPELVHELDDMVKDFETLPQAIGSSATMFWMNDMRKFLKEFEKNMQNFAWLSILTTDIPLSPTWIPTFISWVPFWNSTIRWHWESKENEIVVDSFYFITGYCNSTTWLDRAALMLKWREAAARWRKFNVTIYSENSPVFEGIFGLKGTTVQTATITLVCMLAVCILFVPSAVGVVTAGWAICSISLGVFGFLSWWGLDLDPITMSAIVMSIGFSVDYTAHVSYHFQRARLILPSTCTKTDFLMYTLDPIGWPMMQAAISTLVCFLPVAFHHDYTPSVFVRTITLVVGWGLLHGLVLLPAILAAIPDCLFLQNESRLVLLEF
uniref:SSD domain-containing protein n=1 Tax=Syphacia muris TaxID=451379 RepID=A0A0N5ANG5_9BILA